MKRRKPQKILRALTHASRQPWAIYGPALNDRLAELGEQFHATAKGEQIHDDDEPRGPIQTRTIGNTIVIPVVGTLGPQRSFFVDTSTTDLIRTARAAAGNEQIKKIVYAFDSPGGSAVGNEEAAQAIHEIAQAKDSVAHVPGLCASAAYYLAAATGRIVAAPSSLIGSIGTILIHAEFSEFFESMGVKLEVFHFGKLKAMANPFRQMRAEERQALAEMVSDYGEQFASAVARFRNLSGSAEVRERYGDGKLFHASRAAQIGMIDQLATLEQILTADGKDTRSENDDDHLDDSTPATPPAAAKPDSPAPPAATESTPYQLPKDWTNPSTEEKMNPKLRAALFAAGLIADANADDTTCQTALRAYLAGKGLDPAATSDDDALKMLTGQAPKAEPNPDETPDTTTDLDAIRAEERERVNAIRASGKLLNMPAEEIDAAVDSNHSHADTVAAWHQQLAEAERPVDGGTIQPGPAAADKFTVAAVDALCLRAGLEIDQPAAGATDLANASLLHIAGKAVSSAGGRHDDLDPEQTAKDFLALGGREEVNITPGSAAYHRQANFPNLLAGLVNKFLDQGMQMAEVTYPIWTARLPDLPDFKPASIVGVGEFDELDLMLDDEVPRDLPLDEEHKGWLQIDQYANAVALTVRMVLNDDLDAFTQGLRSLGMAHENTLNRLCVSFLTDNVTLLDGNSLYDNTNHGNDITSGGAPSVTQADAMRKKHRAQTGIGGRGKVRTPPRIALVPSAHETASEQVFLPAPEHRPATDANVNPFRGKIRPVVEQELDDDSTDKWYTFADPRIRRVIVHAFQRGYGRGGRRETYQTAGSNTRHFKIEGRFSAAAAGYRGTTRNAGT